MLGLWAGCGTNFSMLTTYPYALRGPDGEQLKLEDVPGIAACEDGDSRTVPTDDEIAQFRAAVRDLGIEDEDLIDALLALRCPDL